MAKEKRPRLWLDVESSLAQLSRRVQQDVPVLRYGGAELRVHSFNIGCTRAGERVTPHQHSYYEGIWVLKGRGKNLVGLDGSLAAGVCEMHPPHLRHGWQAITDVWRLGVWFDVEPNVPLRRKDDIRLRCFVKKPLETLLQEAESNVPGRRERVAARALLLVAPLLDLLDWPTADDEEEEEPCREGSRVSRLVDRFFEDNLAEPLSLQDAARQMNMSVPTLTRYVRAETGGSVMSRLQKLRIQRAVELLDSGELSVKEIAAHVGIPEPSYFCRCFRRHFGDSPQAWRERHVRNETP